MYLIKEVKTDKIIKTCSLLSDVNKEIKQLRKTAPSKIFYWEIKRGKTK